MGGRILVVDDDFLVTMTTADMLEDLGYASCEANTARQALEFVRSDATIEMILTDLHMPGTNGYQLIHEARALRPELPVILVTGDETASESRSSLSVLAKPYTRGQLATTIKEAYLERMN